MEQAKVVGAPRLSISLESLSDGELLELAVTTETPTESRRVLVMWLYLKESAKVGLEDFDRSLAALAEKELERRAKSNRA